MPKPWWNRVGVLMAVLIVGSAAYFCANYIHHDQETEDMSDAARRGTGGSYVRLSDGVTHYELAGPENARTVVLVHGFSVPYYLWDPTFTALVKAGMRTLRYDLYGRGYSDRPAEIYDADLYDRQLTELLRALKIQGPVDLIGASMGGPVAVVFSAHHPDQMRTLSLFDPAYLGRRTLRWGLAAPLVGEYEMAVDIAPTLAEGQRGDFQHPERYPDYFPKFYAQMRYKGFRRALLSTMRHYFRQDLSGEYRRVGQIHKPVLAIWGREDRAVPLSVSKNLLSAMPQAEFHVIDDAAHLPFYEHPEVVDPMLLEFLGRN